MVTPRGIIQGSGQVQAWNKLVRFDGLVALVDSQEKWGQGSEPVAAGLAVLIKALLVDGPGHQNFIPGYRDGLHLVARLRLAVGAGQETA
jgi:hypothetical protein